jgi:hypothetical protein
MCVFIYVQGQVRYGALTSTWLFHETSFTDPITKQITRLDRPSWERLVAKYFPPAGVSEQWIANMKPQTVKSNYWQTGADLIQSNSGIIHKPLGNRTHRRAGTHYPAMREFRHTSSRTPQSLHRACLRCPQPSCFWRLENPVCHNLATAH